MSKRFLGFMLAGAAALSMMGCGVKKPEVSQEESGTQTTEENERKGYELALITDVGTIDDKSFNQGAWEGLEAYAKEHDIRCKYYKPAEKSDEACLTSIDLAVKGGAKVILTPGFLFEVPVLEAQKRYPDIAFIMVDAVPKDVDGRTVMQENVTSVFYAEEQAGYLAGYAAVAEGYRKLGFMGGIAVPAVVRYGYGFLQGAEAAARELGLEKGAVSVKYTYVGNFDAAPENTAKAAAWYKEGCEVIFACGGAVGNSVMKAAETAGKYVIGVDIDQSSESEAVLTSAMKNLKTSVYDAIASYYNGSFAGGKSITLTAKEDGIMLPMETSRFLNFDQEKYEELYRGMKEGRIEIGDDSIAENAAEVPTELVVVELMK